LPEGGRDGGRNEWQVTQKGLRTGKEGGGGAGAAEKRSVPYPLGKKS